MPRLYALSTLFSFTVEKKTSTFATFRNVSRIYDHGKTIQTEMLGSSNTCIDSNWAGKKVKKRMLFVQFFSATFRQNYATFPEI